MTRTLLPLTKLVLLVSAAVQLVMSLAALFAPALVRSILYPPPLEPSGTLAIQFFGAFYLASAFAAVYALRQNDWIAARTYLALAGPFVALCVVLTLIAALTPPGVPPIMWIYLGLSAAYLPIVAWVWRQQTALQPAQAIG